MDYPLRFGNQTWKPPRDGELTIFLPKSRYGYSFHATFEFVPPWLGDEDYESEHRQMEIMVQGYFPEMKHWHELEGLDLQTREAIEVEGEAVSPEMQGPEIELWSSGEGAASIHTHAKDGLETRLTLKEFTKDDVYTFLCELEAFFPSERARQANMDLLVKQFFGESDFDDEEKNHLLEEGWRFHYVGRLRLNEFSVVAPLNVTNPVGWAQRLVTREFGMTQFGSGRVNGGRLDGGFKPEDGIVTDGRLVLISTPSPRISK